MDPNSLLQMKDLVAVLSLIVSIFAIYRTGVIATRNQHLQERFNEEKKLLENRRFITVLWDRMDDLNLVDPDNPIGPDIRKALNTLETVAMSWQAEIIDKKMVLVSFGRLYERLFDQISSVKVVPGYNRSGKDFLSDNRTIATVYDEIKRLLNERESFRE